NELERMRTVQGSGPAERHAAPGVVAVLHDVVVVPLPLAPRGVRKLGNKTCLDFGIRHVRAPRLRPESRQAWRAVRKLGRRSLQVRYRLSVLVPARFGGGFLSRRLLALGQTGQLRHQKAERDERRIRQNQSDSHVESSSLGLVNNT